MRLRNRTSRAVVYISFLESGEERFESTAPTAEPSLFRMAMRQLAAIKCSLSDTSEPMTTSSQSSQPMSSSLMSHLMSEFPSHLLGAVTATAHLASLPQMRQDYRVVVCFEKGSLVELGLNTVANEMTVLRSLDTGLRSVKRIDVGVDLCGQNFLLLHSQDEHKLVCGVVQEDFENWFVSHELVMEEGDVHVVDVAPLVDGHHVLQHLLHDAVFIAELIGDNDLRWDRLEESNGDLNELENESRTRLRGNVGKVLSSTVLSMHNLLETNLKDLMNRRERLQNFFAKGVVKQAVNNTSIFRILYNWGDVNNETTNDESKFDPFILTSIQSSLMASKVYLRITLTSKSTKSELRLHPLLKSSSNFVVVSQSSNKFGQSEMQFEVVLDLVSLLMHVKENQVCIKLNISFREDNALFQQILCDPRLNLRLDISNKEEETNNVASTNPLCYSKTVHLRIVSLYSLSLLPRLLLQLGFKSKEDLDLSSNNSARLFVNSALRISCQIDDDFRGLIVMGDDDGAMRLFVANLNDFLPTHVHFVVHNDDSLNERDTENDSRSVESSSIGLAKQALVDELSLLISAMEKHVFNNLNMASNDDCVELDQNDFMALVEQMHEAELCSDRHVMQVLAKEDLL